MCIYINWRYLFLVHLYITYSPHSVLSRWGQHYLLQCLMGTFLIPLCLFSVFQGIFMIFTRAALFSAFSGPLYKNTCWYEKSSSNTKKWPYFIDARYVHTLCSGEINDIWRQRYDHGNGTPSKTLWRSDRIRMGCARTHGYDVISWVQYRNAVDWNFFQIGLWSNFSARVYHSKSGCKWIFLTNMRFPYNTACASCLQMPIWEISILFARHIF